MIDFSKPIHTKQDPDNILKILFHDEISIFYENSAGQRFEVTPKAFERYCENVPKEPMKIKGFIGIYKYDTDYGATSVYPTKEDLLEVRSDLKAIVEINATEGEGLQ
jgi:hypothetical protein